MALKKFKSFVNESYRFSDYGDLRYKERKTKFGNWLEKIKGRIEDKSYNDYYLGRRYGNEVGKGSMEEFPDPFNVLGKAVAKGIGLLASAYDSIFSDRVKDGKYRAITDDEWEKFSDKVGNEKVKEKDVESFYTSGALKGKDLFGKKFNPRNPSTEDERKYMEDLENATERYYTKAED
jgi:hypothetical protein